MKSPNSWQQLKAILLLPFLVTVLIPAALYYLFETTIFKAAFAISDRIGMVCILAGSVIFITSVFSLITVGKGTLAPWEPTQKLVVKGLYRYVRNPMILGVVIMLTGEALILNSLAILIWMFLFFVVNTVYFIKKEEPALAKRFGDDYTTYKNNVPRWIPRLTPWRPEKL